MFTKSSLTEHPVRVKIATRAQTEQFALLSEQHWPLGGPFLSLYAFDWQTRFTHIGSPGYRSTQHGCYTPLLPHQSSHI